MNTRTQSLCLIREGLKLANTIILIVDVAKEEVEPKYEKDMAVFQHVADKKDLEIEDLEDDYAAIFLFHGINLVAFNDNNETILLYKTDGTVIDYEA